MRGKRVRVTLNQVVQGMPGLVGRVPIGKVVDVSPIGVEILVENGDQHFFFPWSNVSGMEYLSEYLGDAA